MSLKKEKPVVVIITITRTSIKWSVEKGRTLASYYARWDVSIKPEKEDEKDLKKEDCKFLMRFVYPSWRDYKDKKWGQHYIDLYQFSLQNAEREKLDEAIKRSILARGSVTIIDKGGMYVLAEYESEKEMYCVWKLPKEDFYAIETDGSFKDAQNPPAGSSAFLIRDWNCLVVCAQRCIYKDYKSSNECEAAAIFDAMKEALKRGIKSVEVRSDCESLIQAINENGNIPKNAKSIIQSIKGESMEFDDIDFHFVHRGVNRAADCLSHFRPNEVGTEGRRVLRFEGDLQLPKPVIEHCKDDRRGKPQNKKKKKKKKETEGVKGGDVWNLDLSKLMISELGESMGQVNGKLRFFYPVDLMSVKQEKGSLPDTGGREGF